MTLPRYPRYKDSGVEWLGEVPGHWEVKTLKRLAKLTTGMTPPTDDAENYADDEQLQWIRPDDLDETGAPTTATKFLSEKGWAQARQIKAGATLICCIGTIGKLGFIAEDASTNQQLTAAEFERSNRYFFFAMCAGRTPFEVASTGNVLRILNTERLGNIPFPCPSEVEATQIASFLDRETAKIDELVAEQRRLMALLKEKRQAVISHAVTRGVNPDAPLKPSGIEWLGDVPAHWEVASLKRDLAFLTSGSRGWAENYSDNGDLFIRITNLTRDQIRLDLSDIQRVNVPAGSEGSRTKVKQDDLLLSITAYLGSVAVVQDDLEAAYVSQHVALARLKQEILLPKWCGYVALSFVGKTWFETQSYGGTKIQLSLDDVRNLPIPMPTLCEQREIVFYVENELAQFDTLTAEAQHAIDILQERRTALISAAVTGKIDVRSAEAS